MVLNIKNLHSLCYSSRQIFVQYAVAPSDVVHPHLGGRALVGHPLHWLLLVLLEVGQCRSYIRNGFEFYISIILCCVIPTCCSLPGVTLAT